MSAKNTKDRFDNLQTGYNAGFLNNLKSDIPAGLVVFLVALPLCLGIALASKVNPISGIIAGVIGGIIVGAISGSPLGVSGPAAGLIIIVINAIESLGSFEIFLAAVVLSGVFQVILGLLKVGVLGYYFPLAVIKGMLAGIGVTIIIKQIPHTVGYDKDPEGDMEFFQMDGENSFSELINMLNFVSPGAIAITLISMAILILWERKFFKKMAWTGIIPGPLVAVIFGIFCTLLFKGDTFWGLGQDQLVSIPKTSSVGDFFGLFSFPDWGHFANPDLYIVAATIAVVASLETLLCVEATDKLDPQKRVTPANRELIAQGSGNILSGLIGGLPITQVIVRSSANIQAGGKTKFSAIFHGALLMICVLLIPGVLNHIPYASLAAILLMVGYKLTKPALYFQMFAKGWSQFIPFFATIVVMVFTDLLIGISVGLAIAIVQILWNNFQTPFHFNPDEYKEGAPIEIELSEDVSFLNKAGILHTLNLIPNNSKVIIDGRKNKTIHPDIIEMIENFKENAKHRGIEVECIGMEEPPKKNVVLSFKNLFGKGFKVE
ncbi:MAG: SulP family inorganic anion transporter [Crocinitomicaceae bacterium]